MCLKHRISLKFLINIPEIIPESFLEEVLVGLNYLLDEANFNNMSSIDFAYILERKTSAASLAYNLWNYYNERKTSIPEVIQKWKEICSSQKEFSEIRNQWLFFE